MTSAAPASAPFHLGYLPALDGLRAIAVLMVIFWHLGLPGWKGGFLGVDVFFVLSGFLITTLLVEEWELTGAIGFKRFYLRRALRLFPALALLLIVTAPFVDHSWTLVAIAYVSNWALAFGFIQFSPISHLWSLAIEEQFYLVWPILLVGLLRARVSRLKIVGVAGVLALASAGEKMLLWTSPGSWIRLYHGSDVRADALLVGCILALLLAWGMLPGTVWFRRAVQIAALPALVGVGYLAVTATIGMPFLYRSGGLTLVAIGVGIMLLQTVVAPIRLVSAILEWPPIVGIGRISYGLYLWHFPIAWLQHPWPFPFGHIDSTTGLIWRLVLAFAAAGLSYILIERPALRLKLRFATRKIART
jgi:peptidoglycan/LPS O-acetylase OafA/YrhL